MAQSLGEEERRGEEEVLCSEGRNGRGGCLGQIEPQRPPGP